MSRRTLSKSKLLAYRQCKKRLWLEIHRSDLRVDSTATQASFDVGHQVGEIARRLYDPRGAGQLIDPQVDGFSQSFSRSLDLLKLGKPIFEAGFTIPGALAFADVMLPVRVGGQLRWKMIEVKSSTTVKDYHRDDAAIQSYIARHAGVPLARLALAHIDSQWIYPGGGAYQGLLVEEDLTDESLAKDGEVKVWLKSAQAVANLASEPDIRTGAHCSDPFECPFVEHCQSQEAQPTHPVNWLPRISARALKTHIETNGIIEISDVPDEFLNTTQLRVKTSTLSGKVYFDGDGAAKDLKPHKLPAYFLDFETVQFAVPIWAGTRPFQQIPFQFSSHRLSAKGVLSEDGFLDLSGDDPSRNFAECLVLACSKSWPVFVYNAGFERARIKELGIRFPDLQGALQDISARVVDLLPVAQNRYYHPSQQGSWSIKKVLPAIAPDLRYDALGGVQDGGMAMNAFLEAISPTTEPDRKDEIEQQLRTYCRLDTLAMVRLWQFFSGRGSLVN
jgi:hypothetical protein